MNSNTSDRRLSRVAAPGAMEQYLCFFIAGEEYAVNILEVRELIEYAPVTRVPSVPSFVRGVVNLRGSVVQVIDLALRFGLPETKVTKWTCVVMLELVLDGTPTVVGVLADSVSQVVEFKPEDLAPPPAFGTQAGGQFLKALGSNGQRFVLILAVDRLLAPTDLLPTSELLEAAEATPLQAEPTDPTPEPTA